MTDLRALLHDAAPEPRRALDLDDIRQRARMHGTRRLVAWLGGLGLVIGVAVPLGGAVLQPGNEAGTTVAVHPAPTVEQASQVEVDAASVIPSDGAGTSPSTVVSPSATVGASAPGGRPAVGGSSTPLVDAQPPAAVVDGYPPAVDCWVDNSGLGPSERRVCRFQATRRGGASVHSTPSTASTAGVQTTVRVTRNGTTTAYRIGQNSVDAGDFRAFVGCQFVIEPGDLVEVELVNAPTATGTTTLGAGEGWGC